MKTTPHEMVSTIFMLRSLVPVWLLPPMAIVAFILLAGMLQTLLNLVSNDHGLIVVLGTLLLTLLGQHIILVHAPTPIDGQNALQQSQAWLTMLAFGLLQLILRFLIIPFSSFCGVNLKIHVHLPYAAGVQIACAMLALGLSVIVRYMGPVSIVRSSAFPLLSRPWSTALRTIVSKCTSLDALLDLIAMPSDTPGVLMVPLANTTVHKGRRYQGPRVLTSIKLLVISAGTAFASAIILSLNADTHQYNVILTSSCLSTVLHVLLTCLDGKAHELNHAWYHRITKNWKDLLQGPQIKAYQQSTAISAITVLIFVLSTNYGHQKGTPDHRWALLTEALIVSVLTSLYLSVVDLACRSVLSILKFSWPLTVVEVTKDISNESTMIAAVSSILCHDTDMCKSVLNAFSKTPGIPMEDAELNRHQDAARKMAHILTTASPSDFGLAEDCFRSLVLESLGGFDIESKVDLGASLRQVKTIRIFLDSSNKERLEPLALPLVRALCAYVAGMGMALQMTQAVSMKHHRDKPGENWALPPAAIHCCIWALIAATRCVVFAISGNLNTTDWRGNPISMLVPSVLMSAFQLRTGVAAFQKAESRYKEPSLDTPAGHSGVVEDCPYQQILVACDESAKYLLHTLQSLEGIRSVEINLPSNKECRVWLDSLAWDGAAPPLLLREEPVHNSLLTPGHKRPLEY